MMDPVVSSKYGSRPLLEVPALQVDSGTRLEVSSLQPRPKPDLAASPAFIYRSDGVNQHHQPALAAPLAGVQGVYRPKLATMAPQPPLQQAAGAILPQAPGVPGSLYAPPPGHPPGVPYHPQLLNAPALGLQPQSQRFMDGSGNVIPVVSSYPSPNVSAQPMYPAPQPQQLYPAAQSQLYPAAQPYPMQPQQMYPAQPQQPYPAQPQQQFPAQPQQMYPGVHNPYPGQGYYQPGGELAPPMAPPQPVQYIQPRTPAQDNFRLEGVLEYGRLTTVHFRDKTTNFRGLPEFLRRELQKSYGQFAATDIRIVADGGEFHIYATPRGEGEDFLEGGDGGGGSDTRMIGFNEVRGHPR